MVLRRIVHPEYGLAWYRFDVPGALPEMPSQPRFVHAMFTRLGGVSSRPWASLNLGGTVGDDPAAVRENHRRAFAALGVTADQVVSPHQVHGNQVAVVGPEAGGTMIAGTDALITAQPGVALLLRFADCVPVIFYDPVKHVAALAHAGWRGIAAGVVPATVAALAEHFGTRPNDLWAGIGPAIGPDAYEVGEDVVTAIQARVPPETCVAARRGTAWHLNLPAAVRAQLVALNVGNVDTAGLCTARNTGEWYSHRAENARTGRFGVIAMLT